MFFNFVSFRFRKAIEMGNGFNNLAEENCVKWFDHKQVKYIYLDQSWETQSPLFKDKLRRPDFLVTIPGIGSIFVDVKEREYQTKYSSVILDEADVPLYIQLQKDFKLPVWFAFTLKGSGFASWHWISLDDVLEKVEIRDSGKSGKPFRGVPLTQCRTLGWNDGLSKLISEN